MCVVTATDGFRMAKNFLCIARDVEEKQTIHCLGEIRDVCR